jgi:hypothetical protein
LRVKKKTSTSIKRPRSGRLAPLVNSEKGWLASPA